MGYYSALKRNEILSHNSIISYTCFMVSLPCTQSLPRLSHLWLYLCVSLHLSHTTILSNLFFLLRACVLRQSCPTLCDPVDCSPPGSSVRGILQARILQWVAMSSSRESSQPRDGTWISCLWYWQIKSLPLVPPRKPLLSLNSVQFNTSFITKNFLGARRSGNFEQ